MINILFSRETHREEDFSSNLVARRLREETNKETTKTKRKKETK